jgi:PTH1 family peptidyl-tRNA hydrolase
MWLIVGLGNPGQEYQETRHNLGFKLVDLLAGRTGIEIKRNKYLALIGKGIIGGQKVALAKPQTYMNLCGRSVARMFAQWRLVPGDLIVAHDDLDVDLGRLRLVSGGGSGGHKGVKSIIEALGTTEFIRLKLGIGHPLVSGMDPADFVLDRFKSDEIRRVEIALELGSEAVETILSQDLPKAQSLYNRRPEANDQINGFRAN